MKLQRILVIALGATMLMACESWQPKPDPVLAAQPTPVQVSGGTRVPAQGMELTWGGTVLAVRNHARSTSLEILSYPLDAGQHPITGMSSRGRFIAEMDGFLEPREHPVGTRVTVQGHFAGMQEGRVGTAAYRFPRLRGSRLKVWETGESASRRVAPDVRFGIGIGSGGGGGGVSIGL